MGDLLRREPPNEQVLICGLGLRPAHITLETLQALKKCRTVFHGFLDRRTEDYVRGLCSDVRDLRELCPAGDPGSIADTVLSAAAPGRTAAFLCYGHPLVSRGDVLISRCKAKKIPYRVLAALSPLDEILVAVGAPAMQRGLQICPANEVGRRTPLLPVALAVIMSLDELRGPPGVARFVKYLRTLYPPGHRMALIHCSDIMNGSTLCLETGLRGLAAALEALGEAQRRRASLFIPPVRPDGGSPLFSRRERKDREKEALTGGSRRGPGGRVLVCGLGLRLEHMTVETLQTLKKCDIVFHDFLDEKAAGHMRTLCAELRDLRKLRRDENSEATTDVVLAAVAPGRTIAFLCYGHPMVLQGTAMSLIHRCRAAGIPYRVTASLSALDEIFVAIGTPAIREGLQICLPHKVLRRETPLLPHVPAIIMLLNHLWYLPGISAAGFVKHLKTIYPPEHRVLLIRCRRVVNDPLLRLETSLRGLAGALEKLPEKERFSTSMFIPAAPEPPKKEKGRQS